MQRTVNRPGVLVRPRRIAEVSVVLKQMVALGHAAVIGAEQIAALQFGDDQIDELLDCARTVDRRQHEAVAAGNIDEGFHLIGVGEHKPNPKTSLLII